MISVYIHIPFCSNICSYCDFKYTVATEYEEHLANAHPFKCPQCDNRYDTEAELNEHIKETNHLFKCEYCNSDGCRFNTKGELETHYKNPKCKKNKQQQTQQQQQQRQQTERQQAEQQKQQPAEVFTCQKRGAKLSTKAELNTHRARCTGRSK